MVQQHEAMVQTEQSLNQTQPSEEVIRNFVGSRHKRRNTPSLIKAI
jgi:hypothetical protein